MYKTHWFGGPKPMLMFDANTDGGGTGDPTSDSSNTGNEDTEDSADSGDTEKTDDKGKDQEKDDGLRVPKFRFDQVNRQLQEFRKLGLTPEEISRVIQSIQKTDSSSTKDDGDGLTKQERQVLAILEKVLPHTKFGKELEKTAGRQTSSDEVGFQRIAAEGVEFLEQLSTTEGFQEKHVKYIDQEIADAIRGDEDLTRRFFSGQHKKVIKEVFQQLLPELERSFPRAKKPVDKESKKEKKLPFMSSNTGKGSSGEKKSDASKESSKKNVWKDAGNDAWEMLQAGFSDD